LLAFYRHLPSHGRFVRVARTNHHHVGNGAQEARCSIGWWVGPSSPKKTLSCVTQRWNVSPSRPPVATSAACNRKRSGTSPVGYQAAECHAIDDGPYVLANAEVQIAATIATALKIAQALRLVLLKARDPPTRRPTWQRRCDGIQHFARACLVARVLGGTEYWNFALPASRQLPFTKRSQSAPTQGTPHRRLQVHLPFFLGMLAAINRFPAMRQHLTGT